MSNAPKAALAMPTRRGLVTVHDTALTQTSQQVELQFLLATQAGRFVEIRLRQFA